MFLEVNGFHRKKMGVDTIKILTFFVLLAAMAFPAAAQPYSDPGLGLGGFLRYAFMDSSWSGGGYGAVATRLRLTGGLGIELSAGYHSSKLTKDGATLLEVQAYPIAVSGLVYFYPNHPWQPYLMIGLSYHHIRLQGDSEILQGQAIEHQLGLHGGTGVQVKLPGRFSVFADVRYTILTIDAVKNIDGAGTSYLSAGLGVLFHL